MRHIDSFMKTVAISTPVRDLADLSLNDCVRDGTLQRAALGRVAHAARIALQFCM